MLRSLPGHLISKYLLEITPVTMKITLSESTLKTAETLAQQRGLSLEALIEEIIQNHSASHSHPVNASPEPDASAVSVSQGSLYWLASDSGIPHPHVIIQDDALNHSRLTSTVVCALTSNLHRVSMPGNLMLEAGEGNLPRQSVVEVAKVSSVEKSNLGEYIGQLEEKRIQQILAGLRQQASYTRR